MDVYSYLLKAMGYKTTNKAYLAFYYPDECDLHEGMPFHCAILEVETNPYRAKELAEKAHEILNKPMPENGKNCEYCKWKKESDII